MSRLPQTVVAAPRTTRVPRRPSHYWNIKQPAFGITPLCIAPVLPGETLKNALFQARAVSQPVKNSLLGWWLEYYWFYVKHRDLTIRDNMTAMMLELNYNATPIIQSAAQPAYYGGANHAVYVRECLRRVVETRFRADGETWNADMVGFQGASPSAPFPTAAVNVRSWMDSMLLNSEFTGTSGDPTLVVGVDDIVTGGEIAKLLDQYEFLRANNLTQMDYEDFLSTYGVRPKAEELHEPELLRYVRHWQYPSNTVDPATGVPTAALSWAVSERIDKDRYFREPGFIFGVSLARPKVYFGGQKGAAAAYMYNVMDWLPGILQGDATSRWRKRVDNELVDVSDTNGFWVDIADLYLYGDQFINFDLATTDAGLVALPKAGLEARYPAQADVNALFKDATKNWIAQDGLITMNIQGTTQDTSGTT